MLKQPTASVNVQTSSISASSLSLPRYARRKRLIHLVVKRFEDLFAQMKLRMHRMGLIVNR